MAATTPNRPAPPRAWLAVRPIRDADADAFGALHGRADPAAVRRLIAESRQAFDADGPGPLRQVFVLVEHAAAAGGGSGGDDDDDRGALRGAIALVGSAGLDLPRHAFRRGVVVHASAELKLFHRAGTLVLCNDLTGCAEIGLPRVTRSAEAAAHQRLLVDAALLFVAARPDRCAGTLVAALPGIRYDGGGSPFWSGLGRHFHAGPVPDDDPFWPSAARSHIGRLFPKHPLYASFLGADAQACIGQRALHARALDDALQAQGFRSHGHVDIFDGGPLLMAELRDLAALRSSRHSTLRIDAAADAGAGCLLLRPGESGDGAAAWWVPATLDGGAVCVTPPVARAIGLAAGARLRVFVPSRG